MTPGLGIDTSKLIEIFARQECRTLSETKMHNGIRISFIEELTLSDYVIAKELQCKQLHTNCTQHCSCFVNAGKIVLEEKFVSLPYLWNKCFGKTYDCEKAQRKLLRMPIVSINVNGKVFIVEKEYGSTDYESKRNIIAKVICNNSSYKKKANVISKQDYQQLLSTAETTRKTTCKALCYAVHTTYRKGTLVIFME